MIISVASGKGGTGKTTIAVNLVLSLGSKATYIDCDVEEPNGHLFLRPEITDTREISTFIPEVDESRCDGCRKCVDICRFRAITVVGSKVLVFPELCHSCEGCMIVCPQKAITPGGRILGELEEGRCAENIPFRQGRLRVGEAMAPPLIRAARKAAGTTEVVIVDAPPGTSCPAIAATQNSDFVLMVTEPTPFGLHDLKLAVEAVSTMHIPCGLVINRSDIGDDGVRNYAAEVGMEILLEIPFSRAIAEAYSKGMTIVELMPEWREQFRQLYEKIQRLTEKNREVCL